VLQEHNTHLVLQEHNTCCVSMLRSIHHVVLHTLYIPYVGYIRGIYVPTEVHMLCSSSSSSSYTQHVLCVAETQHDMFVVAQHNMHVV